MRQPDVEFLKQKPAHLLALGFGSGLASPAPGTWGTLAALPCWWLLAQTAFVFQLFFVASSFLLGVWICGVTSNNLGRHDHGSIVWDEFVGLWLTMLFLPQSWTWWLAGFVLFRFFDIVKPWPIKWFDQKVHGGLGIMLDDAIAALFAAVLLLAVARLI